MFTELGRVIVNWCNKCPIIDWVKRTTSSWIWLNCWIDLLKPICIHYICSSSCPPPSSCITLVDKIGIDRFMACKTPHWNWSSTEVAVCSTKQPQGWLLSSSSSSGGPSDSVQNREQYLSACWAPNLSLKTNATKIKVPPQGTLVHHKLHHLHLGPDLECLVSSSLTFGRSFVQSLVRPEISEESLKSFGSRISLW